MPNGNRAGQEEINDENENSTKEWDLYCLGFGISGVEL